MTDAANMIFKQALELSSPERSEIVERLLNSLDNPDSTIDAIWAEEADARIEAYQRGEIEAVPIEKVFSKYRPS